MSTKEDISVGDVTCPPGDLAKGGITLGWLEDGSPIYAPLLVLNGALPGPILFVSAAMHGNEIVGAEVIRRLIRVELQAATLHGAVVACPILHPVGFRLHQALTPRDGMNLISAFPGDPEGSSTQQLAHAIFDGLLMKADFVVDIHSNPWPSLEWVMTAGADTEIGSRCRKLALAFGLPLIELSAEGEGYSMLGTMLTSCMEAGKPAILVELTANRRFEHRPVQLGVNGMLDLMKAIGMLAGEAAPRPEVSLLPAPLRYFRQIRARRGGFMHRACKPGEEVVKGQVLARIYDPYGDVVEETHSPVSGYVLAYGCWVNQTVQSGGFVVAVGASQAQMESPQV